MQVYTAKGVVNRDALTVKDIITEEGNARVTATEWFMGDELVRRDVNVNILVGQSFDSEQGAI